VYNPPAIFAVKLIAYCRLHNIKLILDTTEWYESSHLIGGKLGLASIENFIRMYFVYPRFSRVIAISEFLQHYFLKFTQQVVKVPPLLTTLPLQNNVIKKDKECIRLIYAGSPGKKDDILTIISLLPLLNEMLDVPVCLRVIGTKAELLIEQLESLEINYTEVSEFLEIYDRMSMAEVEKHYRVADFSIIFRENKRYAIAGFPTKFVESISFGVPVIANKVGDIQKYINKHKVGFLVDTHSIQSDLYNIFQSYIADQSLRKSIVNNCHVLAEKEFLYSNYSECINKIL
jgi:glycosyltransferase involved in cell wall biosynthesis